jgi:predicted amidophosphoribosyltransferase
MADRIATKNFTAIVAVPTSAKKKRKRGYGHAEEIGKACAEALGCTWIPDAIVLTRSVADQTRLNAVQRKANMTGAFALRDGLSLTDAEVLVVDDVLTTGATLGEAGRVLQAAGARAISGGVVALNLSMQARGQ